MECGLWIVVLVYNNAQGNCPAKCCVDAETVLCLRRMPEMHRHQLALSEGEKEGSRRRNSLPAGLASHTEVQPATSTWSPGNYSGAAVPV